MSFAIIGHAINKIHGKRIWELFSGETTSNDIDIYSSLPPLILEEKNFHFNSESRSSNGYYIDALIAPKMYVEKSSRKVLKALRLASSHDANIISLGGLTSILVQKEILAEDGTVSSKYWAPGIDDVLAKATTGNTLTAYSVVEAVKYFSNEILSKGNRVQIAVTGAAGDIGQGVCRWISKNIKYSDLYLVGRTKESVKVIAEECRALSGVEPNILGSVEEAINKFPDVVVSATNQTSALSLPTHTEPREGRYSFSGRNVSMAIIDCGYPKNVQFVQGEVTSVSPIIKDITVDRKSVLLVDGGLMRRPDKKPIIFDFQLIANEVQQSMGIGTPIDNECLYGCFVEAMVLAMDGMAPFPLARGQITPEAIDSVGLAARRQGFEAPVFTELKTAMNSVFQMA